MKKILALLSVIAIFSSCTPAFTNSIDKIISKSTVKRGTISVSVRNLADGAVLYDLNSDKLVPPASTQKLVTLAAALNTLGEDYKFRTALYKSTNNDLYLQLGADPFLTSKNLNSLFAEAYKKNIIEPKNVYIDDDIVDTVEWGEGWQWDDELNPSMPKFGAYNLDNNLIDIVIMPMEAGTPAKIYTKKFYPITFMNMVTTGDKNNVEVEKTAVALPDMLTVKGTVAKPEIWTIPLNNLKRYFRLRMEDSIKNSKIEYYGNIQQKDLPTENVYLVSEVTHPIKDAISAVFKDSDNLAAETVFKLAGGKFINDQGSVHLAILMFKDFCLKSNIDCEDIRIVDGSGVSKNNLMSADFMTSFLVAISKMENFETYKASMASPGEGTLTDRMLYFNENLKAKTGTLSDISAIAGYITTQKGNELAFDIMINDAKTSNADKKMLEEYIIRALFTEF